MALRITTWNVNGIRNPFGHPPWRETRTFEAMFDILDADIVVMQELKIQRKDLKDDMVLVKGWDCYFTIPKAKKGYSGVAIYTRKSKCAPIRAEEGLLGVLCPPESSVPYCELPSDRAIGGYLTSSQLADIEALGVDPSSLDTEGRCLILEFPAFVIFGVYSPANSNGLRDDFRYGFICALDMRIRNLQEMGKRVILTGDLNVSRSSLDTANLEQRLRDEGMSFEDYASMPNRRIFHQLLEGGEVFGDRDPDRQHPVLWDVCRGFHEGRKGMFTHWEQKINARPGNYGSRIDYVLGSISMKSWFSEANIQEGLMGSDHCPVYAVLKEKVNIDGKGVHLVDIMNPPGMFDGGKRSREYDTKKVPALSGRLLPEFAQRRSIKDMFAKRSSNTSLNDSGATAVSNRPAAPPSFATKSPITDKAEKIRQSNTALPGRSRNSVISSQSSQSLKRSKSNAMAPTSVPPKGQKTLQGFFRPKGSSGVTNTLQKTVSETNESSAPSPKAETLPSLSSTDKESGQRWQHPNGDKEGMSPRNDVSAANRDEPGQSQFQIQDLSLENSAFAMKEVHDPIVSKEGWNRLFTKKGPPRCEDHGEPCILLTTKKAGINCGRAFFICPRPVGPTGNKERGTQWKCPHFQWASDWNGAN